MLEFTIVELKRHIYRPAIIPRCHKLLSDLSKVFPYGKATVGAASDSPSHRPTLQVEFKRPSLYGQRAAGNSAAGKGGA